MRNTGIFIRSLVAIILAALVANAGDSGPSKPPTKKPDEPSAPAVELKSNHDLLWLLKADRKNLSADFRKLLETLDKSKVPTLEKAEGAALGAKLKGGGVDARENAQVVGLLRLGVDVPEFAASGDLVWVVRIQHTTRGVTQEFWVSSTTAAIRATLPLEAKPAQK